jgi:MarR-like DNA-binding transcriptional regulator SgrR of sgrS sRNA
MIYSYICAYLGEWGYPPTVREIACACFCAPATVNKHLHRLQLQGRIDRQPNCPRGVIVVRR